MEVCGAWLECIIEIEDRPNGPGFIARSLLEFACLFRTTEERAKTILNILSKFNVADVSEDEKGEWKVLCRRFIREESLREKRSEAGRKGGSKTQFARNLLKQNSSKVEATARVTPRTQEPKNLEDPPIVPQGDVMAEPTKPESEELNLPKRGENFTHPLPPSRAVPLNGKYSAEIVEIVSHLNAKTGLSYKLSGEKTRELIRARLDEGFTVDEFKAAIDCKTAQWLGTDKAEFLRPKTLFSKTNFESYVQQARLAPIIPGESNSMRAAKEYLRQHNADPEEIENDKQGMVEVLGGFGRILPDGGSATG